MNFKGFIDFSHDDDNWFVKISFSDVRNVEKIVRLTKLFACKHPQLFFVTIKRNNFKSNKNVCETDILFCKINDRELLMFLNRKRGTYSICVEK